MESIIRQRNSKALAKAILKQKQNKKIYAMREQGISINVIAKNFGMPESSVRAILKEAS